MKRNIIYCEQGTPEWDAVRVGRVTASHFHEVLSGKGSSGWKTYMKNLVGERMTNQPAKTYSNKAMEDGLECEPRARDYYAGAKGVLVQQVGFVQLGDDIGCSPDGLVDDDGLVQIKCPYASTHCDYILKNVFPSQYKAQVQGELWVTQRQWSDFVSYHEAVKNRPLWSVRVERNEQYIQELAKAVQVFVEELKAIEAKLIMPF